MDWLVPSIIGLVVGAAAGAFAVVLFFVKKYKAAIEDSAKATAELEQVKSGLESQKKDIAYKAEKSAEDRLAARKEEFEREAREARNEIKNVEKRLEKREDMIEKREGEVREREKGILRKESKVEQLEQQLEARQTELEDKVGMIDKELQRVAGMSREDAERRVLNRVEEELSAEIGALVQKATDKINEEVDEKARELLISSVQRYSGEQVSEMLVSTVDLPSDDMKGRIIGREGRNIRAFEKVTGTDVVVDDTPGVVIVSAFDPVRREIARRALEKLISDGRIHPARIEEVVEKIRQDTLNEIQKAGQDAFDELHLPKPHPKIAMHVGRLKFRFSYGQNVLKHSIEVAHIMGMVAAELGLDPVLAKRCGLLHDIGKAIDHESEGTHTELGMEVAKRYGEPKEVINAIGSHHEKMEADNIYSILVKLMDSVSAGRPGARSESLEKYLKRLEKLEAIATSMKGIDQAFAIQAGREIRVIVNADQIGDKEVHKICRDIATTIEKELTYPGEIRVTCIRETRVVEIAR